jgi:hypothetical protein
MAVTRRGGVDGTRGVVVAKAVEAAMAASTCASIKISLRARRGSHKLKFYLQRIEALKLEVVG